MAGTIKDNILSWGDTLSLSKPGAIMGTTTGAGLFFGLSINTARIVFLVLFLVFFLLAIISAMFYFRWKPIELRFTGQMAASAEADKKAKQIAKKYRERIVEGIGEISQESVNVTNLNSVDDLIKVAMNSVNQ